MKPKNILMAMCPHCEQETRVLYGDSLPLKCECDHCGEVINIYQIKDTIEQTRSTKIEKEDR